MSSESKQKKCNQKMEIYSRVVGFFRPVEQWNEGKREEFSDRMTYTVSAEKPIVGIEADVRPVKKEPVLVGA